MMIDALLQVILGPLGGILAGLGAVVAALALGRWQGASKANQDRASKDAKDYKNERQEIDDDLRGIGGDDDARRRQLHDIAKRRGSGPN